MKQPSKDLTQGSLWKNIFVFSIPLMLSNVLQVLFNMSDIAVVGRFAGPLALGSVGSTAILVTMFTGFLIGLAGGINVLTALYLGAGKKQALSHTVHSALIVSICSGLALLLFGICFARPVLEILHTKEELIEKLESFKGLPQELKLPSAPAQFIRYMEEDNRPQVSLDVDFENGMGISVGRLREDTVYDYKFVGLSHNTVRGAAGGAVLCAELLTAKGYIKEK